MITDTRPQVALAQIAAEVAAKAAREKGALDVLGADAETAAAEERVFPRRLAPIMEQDDSFCAEYSWGFEVPGHDDLVFNTRVESALDGMQLWQQPLREGRGIASAFAFFETHKTQKRYDAKTKRNKRVLYRFQAVEEPFMLMAALTQDGRFSVLTEPADNVVKPIHGRMPLLLTAQEAQAWLRSDCTPHELLRAHLERIGEGQGGMLLSAQPDEAQGPGEIEEQLELF